jgi:gas vesicle protein
MTNQRVLYILATGVGAGILVGGLFAPRAGDASRKLIAKRAQRARKVLKSAVNDGTRFLTRRGTEVRDQASELMDRSRGMYRAAGKLLHAAM